MDCVLTVMALLVLMQVLICIARPSAAWSGVTQVERLVLSPSDFTELEDARVVSAEGTADGRAILVEKEGGYAQCRVALGDSGQIPFGLYQVKVQLGTRDGTQKWAVVHIFPEVYGLRGNGGWSVAFVRSGEPGQWTWRENRHLVALTEAESEIRVWCKGDPGFYVGEIVLERVAPYRDLPTDSEFFGLLDRSRSALSSVHAAADAGDYRGACSELVSYLRKTPRGADGDLGGVIASGSPTATGGAPSEAAELLLGDRMMLRWDPGNQGGYCTGEIHRLPPTEFSFATPEEWHRIYDYPGRRWYGWFLSTSLKELARAYAATGDVAFASKAMQLIGRFITEWAPFPRHYYYEGELPNPYYTLGPGPASHPSGSFGTYRSASGVRNGLIEAVWEVLKVTGGCNQISDRQRVEALKLCVLLARYVRDIRNITNGVPPNSRWLIGVGRWLPEIPEFVDMSQEGLCNLMAFVEDCFFPDGAYYELCYYRHGLLGQAMLDAAAQGLDVDPFLERFRRCVDFNLYMTRPMGNFPWINDEGGGENVDPPEPRPPAYAQAGLELYPDDPQLTYAFTFGKEGEVLKPASRHFPWCGFMVMRTGWDPDALHLVFDGCRNTGSHNHNDQMNIVLTAYGSTLICDTGYVGTGFSAPDRFHYIFHPRGHNLLMVDELNQTRVQVKGDHLVGWRAWGNEPRANTWISTEGYDYAETDYDRPYYRDAPEDGREVSRQQRRILFLKPPTGTPYWVMYDLVWPKSGVTGDHDLQLIFHFPPTSSASILKNGRGVQTEAENAGLVILSASDGSWLPKIVKGDARPEDSSWQGFVSGGYGRPLVPTPTAVFRYNGGLPAGVATVLYPYPRARSSPVEMNPMTVGDTGPLPTSAAVGFEIRLEDGSDTVMASAEPGSEVRYGPYSFDGRAAVVRRDPAGDLTSVLMVDGTRLTRDGEIIVDTGSRRAASIECRRGAIGRKTDNVSTAQGLVPTEVRWPEP